MNTKLRYYPIGSIVIYENIQLAIVAQKGNRPSCAGCFFNYETYRRYISGKRISCCTHGMACTSHMRRDKKHVIFQLIDK